MLDNTISPDDILLLIIQAKLGDSDAFATIFRNYRRRVYGLTSGYFAPGADRDDLLQEATIGFFKAVRDFNFDQGSFATFVILCVRRQLITFVKRCTTAKHRPLNKSLSIDAPIDAYSQRRISDSLQAPEATSNGTCSVVSEAMNSLSSACSPLEKDVLDLYASGSSYADISTRLNITPKVINNALWRFKKKAIRLGLPAS